MKPFLTHAGLTVMAVLSMVQPSVAAAPATPVMAPPPAGGSARDLSGIWENPEGQNRTFDPKAATSNDEKPPLNTVWAAEWGKTRERVRQGMAVWDPNIRCLPPGMPRTMNASYPFEILMTPGRVTLIAEYFNEIRKLYADGRGHPGPDDLEPTFEGHSVAHWEGDTLIIDTVGLRSETVIDLAMVPHSDQMHVVERVRKIAPDKLEWTLTLTDPVVLSRPWTETRQFVRSPPGTEIREFVCADNNQADKYTPSAEDAKYSKPDPRLKTQP
jgi:hypothetical protein